MRPRIRDHRDHRRGTTRPAGTATLSGLPAPSTTGSTEEGSCPRDPAEAVRGLRGTIFGKARDRWGEPFSAAPSLLSGLLAVRWTQHISPTVGGPAHPSTPVLGEL